MAEVGFVVCNGRLAVGHVWGMEAWPSATNDLLTASIVIYIAASPACCEALLIKKAGQGKYSLARFLYSGGGLASFALDRQIWAPGRTKASRT